MKTKLTTLLMIAALLTVLLSGCFRGTRAPEPTEAPTPAAEVTPDIHEGMIEVTNGAGGTLWVDEADRLTPFSLDRYSFSVTDGIVTYTRDDGTVSHGVDVSEYQHEIDWQAVADAGIEFAIVRVGWRGYGGGTLAEDTMYRENIQGAQAVGLRVGAYFFSQAISVLEAAEEAVFTARLLDGITLDLPVFFDWEIIGTEPARTDDVDAETLTQCCLEYCRLLESAGIPAGVYSYIPVVYLKYDLNELEGLTFWMGDPGNWPEFYYEHSIWQYSFTGTVPGIEGEVDLDVLYLPASDTTAAESAVVQTEGSAAGPESAYASESPGPGEESAAATDAAPAVSEAAPGAEAVG